MARMPMLMKIKAAAVSCLMASLAVVTTGEALGQHGHGRTAPAAPPCRRAVELPAFAGVDELPDPARTAVPAPPLPPLDSGASSRIYRGLDAGQCASLAAANSEEAAVIDARRVAIMAELPRHGDDPSRQMLIKGLGYEAAEARNQDACKALTLSYRLAQAQLQGEILRRSRLEVAGALRASKDQVDRGLLSGQAAYDALRLKEVDLIATQVELAGTTERINLTLRNLLGVVPVEGDWMIRPLVDWEEVRPAPDASEAVAVGMARSPQLLLLRTVVAEVDSSSKSAVEQLLAAVSPLAGSTGRVGPSPGLAAIVQVLKHPKAKKESVEAVRARARQTLAWRERALEADIRAAVLNIESGLRELAVARDSYALRSEELDRLLKKADRGLTPGLEIATARLELLRSQGRWVDLLGELEVRRVELDRLTARFAGPTPPPAPPVSMIAR